MAEMLRGGILMEDLKWLKKKFGIVFLVLILLILAGYMKMKNNSHVEETQKREVVTEEPNESSVWEKGYNLPVVPKEAAEAKKECAEIAASIEEILQKKGMPDLSVKENDDEVQAAVLELIGKMDYPVLETGIYRRLYNYEKVEEFLKNAENSKVQEVVVFDMHSEAGFAREKFYYDGSDMYLLFTNVSWTDKGKPQIASSTYCRIKEWEYTEKGWFSYELCVPEPPEVTEVIIGNMLMRVRPVDEGYGEIAEKYLLPIGYQGNNLFCSEWDENHMEDIDYNGLFEYFYAMKYGVRLDQEKYGNGISRNEFFELIQDYLNVTSEQLEQYAVYDNEKKIFAWVGLGCGNYEPNAFGTSFPEITDIKANEDGTVTIKVDAVCEMAGTDKIFSHELTIEMMEDGGIRYIRNHILEPGLENVSEYQYRLKAKQ